jgi:hypothetical protein
MFSSDRFNFSGPRRLPSDVTESNDGNELDAGKLFVSRKPIMAPSPMAGNGIPSFFIPKLTTMQELSEEEMLALDRSPPWERVNLEELARIPDEFDMTCRTLVHVTLGPLKELAVLYLNSRLPIEKRISKTASNKVLLDTADSLNLRNLIYVLHLENTGKIESLDAHRLFISYRYTQKMQGEREKHNKASKINLFSQGGEIQYFDGIDLVLGRERDSLIRPMLNRFFKANRSKAKQVLDSVNLKIQDLRTWSNVELCKALWILGKQIDPVIWQTASKLHQLKMIKKYGRDQQTFFDNA